MKKCRDNNVTPAVLKIKPTKYIDGPHTRKALKQAEILIIKARIKDIRMKFQNLLRQLEEVKQNISQFMDEETINTTLKIFDTYMLTISGKRDSKMTNKFAKLLPPVKQDNKTQGYSDDNIVNLTNMKLTQEEQEALSRGLNFCFGIKQTEDGILDKIIAFEKAIEMNSSSQFTPLNPKRIDSLRDAVKSHIKWYERNNKTVDMRIIRYRKCLSNMRKNNNICIMKADKGNSTVIMDRNEYEEKIVDLLKQGPYKTSTDRPNSYRKKVRDYSQKLFKSKK